MKKSPISVVQSKTGGRQDRLEEEKLVRNVGQILAWTKREWKGIKPQTLSQEPYYYNHLG